MQNLLLAGLALIIGCAKANLLSTTVTEWFWQSSIAVNEYLYIIGGEQYDPNFEDGLVFDETAYVVDLSQSWTNQTLAPTNTTARPEKMVAARQPLLYYDAQQNTVNRYGGWPYYETEYPSTLWSFPAGSAAMNWQQGLNASSNGLTKGSPGPFAAAYAYSDNAFFSFGGSFESYNPSSPITVLSGLAVQNFTSGKWDNTSTAFSGRTQYRTQSRAVLSPHFGHEGFLVIVGGEAPPTSASVYYEGRAMVDMSAITLYDIANNTWFVQTADGDVPSPRSEFCAVGSPSSDRRTFEMQVISKFVFGGAVNTTFDLGNPDDDSYKDVFVLSLPAFLWFRDNATAEVRKASHTCSIIGKRQMVSIGGRLPSSRSQLGLESDPWTSGIGVFNMSGLHWQDHYDAGAPKYDSPDAVKQYYRTSYQEPSWSNDSLASIFEYTGQRASKEPNPTSAASQESNTPVGVIVGATVGGVAAFILICGGPLLLRQHRRKKARSEQEPGGGSGSHSDMALKTTSQEKLSMQEALQQQPVHEVEGHSRTAELPTQSPTTSRAELPDRI